MKRPTPMTAMTVTVLAQIPAPVRTHVRLSYAGLHEFAYFDLGYVQTLIAYVFGGDFNSLRPTDRDDIAAILTGWDHAILMGVDDGKAIVRRPVTGCVEPAWLRRVTRTVIS